MTLSTVDGFFERYPMETKGKALLMCLAVPLVLCCQDGNAGSRDLARSVEATIADTSPEDWPESCLRYREDFPELSGVPQSVDLEVQRPEAKGLQLVAWNGLQIPVPESEIQSVAMIPQSIAAVVSQDVGVIFSSIELAPHFDHFEGIEGFSGYVHRRDSLVDWIDDGLALGPDDMECRPGSMHSDLVHLIHSLVVGIAVTVGEGAFLARLNEPHAALLVGDPAGDSGSTRIKYIFQNPNSTRSQLLTLTYTIKEPVDVPQWMNMLATAIEGGAQPAEAGVSSLVRAILQLDYLRASSISDSNGWDVRMGVP